MTRKIIKAEAVSLESRPDLAALVADFRAAAVIDTGMVEQIAQRAALILDKRGDLPDRSVAS